MNGKTKRILIRRRIREVITVKQPKTFVCDHCGTEQTFKLSESLKTNDEKKITETRSK
jgi:transcription elongation factor Elf1